MVSEMMSAILVYILRRHSRYTLEKNFSLAWVISEYLIVRAPARLIFVRVRLCFALYAGWFKEENTGVGMRLYSFNPPITTTIETCDQTLLF